jgi:V/A-type H+-transporting ATPase subunit D
MARPLIKVAPTKSNLIRLRKQVRFLEEGHSLLERKRELLTRLVYERIRTYRDLREQARRALTRAYRALSITQMRMGGRALQQAALGTDATIAVDILPRSSLGVQYPSVEARALELKPVGLMGVDSIFDETRRAMTEAALLLARLSEVEMALGRLIAEQRKAQKRVNALRYNIIPRYLNTIRFIQSALEEEERNTLFQLKVLRAAKQHS